MPATQFSSPEATTVTSFFAILDILYILYKYKKIYTYFLSLFFFFNQDTKATDTYMF